jgi:tetratricopeptide (TPR) repeat protein
MLTSYGEGKEKALSRLYDELETESISAYTIPFSRNPQFVGRESQLALLESKLFRDNEKTTRVAIQGSGGTGKSQLALELAYRTKEEYKSCSIFWIDASEPDAFYQAYSNIAQKLDIHRGSDEQVDVRQLVKLELSRKNTRQWLLIIDNADDLNLGSAQSLVDYFPQSNMGSIILTSTSSDAAKAMAGENVVQLLEMTLHSARTMLENQLTSSNLIRQEKEVQLLLEQLSCLPLSIVQAAAYINNTENITLEAYRLRVITEKMDWFRASGPSCEKRLSDSDAGSPATATALISLHQIRHNHSSAAHCLFLAACVSPKDIPLDLIGAISSRAKENAVRVLDAYALATRRPAESSFDIHRLLHLAIQGWLRKQSSLQGWAERAIAILLEIFPANPDQDMWSRSKWRRLLPHAMYALSTAQESEAWVRLSRRCTAALMDDGRWKEAEGLQVQIIEATKRVLGLEHEQTLAVMSDLALIYRRQKRLKEAEVLGLDLIVTYKRLSGAEDSKLLECMGNLGSTYHDQGRWKEAEELQVQATELAKRVLGLEHADTAASMNNLANTYVIQGRHREAEELQVQVVEIHKRVRGAEHPKTTSAMNNLALMLMGRGQWREAEELQVQVVETKKRVLGAEHPDTLEVLRNLILIYEHQGRWNEVEELLWEHRRFTVGEQVESEGPWREAEELQWENV